MKRAGALALLMLLVCPPAAARHRREIVSRPGKRSSVVQRVPSPDHQNIAVVTARGGVRVNGHLVAAGTGRVLGAPVWRRDSGALAFLQRSAHKVQLVILPDLLTPRPLIYRLPVATSRRLRPFWISSQRVGVGTRPPVPRVAVSWTTMLASVD